MDKIEAVSLAFELLIQNKYTTDPQRMLEHDEISALTGLPMDDVARLSKSVYGELSPIPIIKVESGEVYFIKAEGTDLIKIGISEGVGDRFRNIQSMSPLKLTLLFTFPTDNPLKLERKFHHTLKKHRDHGEWFKLTPRILSRIEKMKGCKKA